MFNKQHPAASHLPASVHLFTIYYGTKVSSGGTLVHISPTFVDLHILKFNNSVSERLSSNNVTGANLSGCQNVNGDRVM